MIACELGSNHQGDTAYADEYINALSASGADAVVFQLREPSRYAGEFQRLLLPADYYAPAFARIHSSGLRVGVALADASKLEFFEHLHPDFYKVLGQDIANYPLLTALFQTGKNVFVSTGMSNFEQIGGFITWLADRSSQCTLIHTQLSYEIADVQLKAIPKLRQAFGLPVAFGSHAKNFNVLYAALAFEPSDLFFYVKGDRAERHLDHDHAIPLARTGEVIKNLRELSQAMGSGEKIKMENLIKKAGL